MFSKVYKAIHSQLNFRNTCMMIHWQFMRDHDFIYRRQQAQLDKIFGKCGSSDTFRRAPTKGE